MVQHPPWDRQQGSVCPCSSYSCEGLLVLRPMGEVCTHLSPLICVFLNQERTFSLTKPQKTDLATTCTSASLRSNRFWSKGVRRVLSRHHTAMEQELLRKGGTSTFCAHISSPVGQSTSALLLAVLLGEECSALFMAMNSSLLFIQLSSACWLQPQPAPSHCMTPS